MKAEWKFHKPAKEEGVIVGCTQSQEWLLPWWWMNFRICNPYPVTFVNFGDLSDQAITWCQQRGDVLTLDLEESFICKQYEVDSPLAALWENMNCQVWKAREAWFKKPLVLLETPYKKTIWLDLDCQVRGAIAPLFHEYLSKAEVAISAEVEIEQRVNQEKNLLLPNEVMYNGGVIAFHHGAKLIQEWAKQSIDQNHLFIGDQQLLSRIIFTQNFSVENLPITYNWPIAYGIDLHAVILHWWGNHKLQIYLQIHALQKLFYINLSF